MKRSTVIVAVLLLFSGLTQAEDSAWGEVAGGTFEEKPISTDAPTEQGAVLSGNDTCGQDDPRMQNLVAVLKELKAGASVEPLQISFSTYMGLSEKIRSILGDNIVISTANCKKQFIFDGELTGKVEMPFPEALTHINEALRARDLAKLKFVFDSVKVTPDTLNNIVSYTVGKAFSLETGAALIKIGNLQEIRSDDTSVGVLMLDVFQALGGSLAEGEGTQVKLYVYNGDMKFIVFSVYTNEGYITDIGSALKATARPGPYETKFKVTDLAASRLSGAYSSLGISTLVTSSLPEK